MIENDFNWETDWGFESLEGSEEKKLIKDIVKYKKYLKCQYQIVENITDLIKRLPIENEIIRIRTQGRFNAFAFVLFVQNFKKIKELYITTYRVDMQTVKWIENLLKNKVKITLVASAFFTTLKKKEPFAERLIQLTEIYNDLRLIFCHNHTKIILIETKDNEHYIIEGSGNMSGNARIEQYMLIKGKEDYDFDKKWIENIRNNSSGKNAKFYNF